MRQAIQAGAPVKKEGKRLGQMRRTSAPTVYSTGNMILDHTSFADSFAAARQTDCGFNVCPSDLSSSIPSPRSQTHRCSAKSSLFVQAPDSADGPVCGPPPAPEADNSPVRSSGHDPGSQYFSIASDRAAAWGNSALHQTPALDPGSLFDRSRRIVLHVVKIVALPVSCRTSLRSRSEL